MQHSARQRDFSGKQGQEHSSLIPDHSGQVSLLTPAKCMPASNTGYLCLLELPGKLLWQVSRGFPSNTLQVL